MIYVIQKNTKVFNLSIFSFMLLLLIELKDGYYADMKYRSEVVRITNDTQQ